MRQATVHLDLHRLPKLAVDKKVLGETVNTRLLMAIRGMSERSTCTQCEAMLEQEVHISKCGHLFCESCGLCPDDTCHACHKALHSREIYSEEELEGNSVQNASSAQKLQADRKAFCAKLEPSTKMKQIEKYLSNIPRDQGGYPEKALIFSQWTEVLDILEPYLMTNRHVFRRINGQMPSAKRGKPLDKFRELPNVST